MGWIKLLGLGLVIFFSFLYLLGYIFLTAILAVSVAFVSGVLIFSWKIPGWFGLKSENKIYLVCFIICGLLFSSGIIILTLKFVRIL